MEELKNKINQLENQFGEVIPLLVTDEWEVASQKMGTVLEDLIGMLSMLINNQVHLKSINFEEVKTLVEELIYAMNISDTIQMADILLYDIRGVFQDISEQIENA